jgi:myxalamid-type polyketide synthase MxaE and MxaD
VTYLVTGGLGGVALHVARAMAAGGARRLVLLGRTALPSRDQWRLLPPGTRMAERVAAVRELEGAGVAVHVACVDVGDEAELRAFLDGFEREAWPPIRGVVHAAGTLDNHLAGAMDVAAFDAVVGPKLRGAQLLDRLLPDLDLFVLFSSTGAFLAQPGQANYAAANAGLDALALDRRARGRPALSIGWGVWLDTGLVKGESGQSGVAELARQGIQGFAPERGASLFAWLCGRLTGSCAVIPVDWNAYRRSRSGRPIALLRTLVGDGEAVPALRDHPELESPAVRRARVETLVREAVGAVLKVAPARLDPRRALGNMGFNSLMAMELRNRLEASLGRPLSATLAWNYPTVNALVGHLAGDEPAVATPAPSAPAAPAKRIADVAALSDDDAALALRTRRPRA